MLTSAACNLSKPAPDGPSRLCRSETLGSQITELCGYINAATFRLLEMIREFDQDGLWEMDGMCSCAHWLNWRCGIGMNAAREKVRVANALGDISRISESFSRGEISYSKVRAMDQDDQDVSAETSGAPAESDKPYKEPIDRRRADALADIAESYLANGPTGSSAGDRYQVMLHVCAETLTDASGNESPVGDHIEDGPHVSAETSRRLCCDTTISVVSEARKGETLNIGRKSRIIPPAMRRACSVSLGRYRQWGQGAFPWQRLNSLPNSVSYSL